MAGSGRASWAARTRLLGADSTVDGLALAGRLRLYRGDLAGAVERFKAAGPYAGDRSEATQRTSMLALLQPIEADSLGRAGAALLLLERGDTAEAAAGPGGGGGQAAGGQGRRRAATAGGADRPRRPARRPTPSGCSAPPR